MTDQELGQLFIVGFGGCELDDGHPMIRCLEEDNPGGIILFDRNVDGSCQNIRSPRQLQELISALQEHAVSPLLVTVDQEGGKVCRLKERDGFGHCLSAAQLGEKGDLNLTRETAAQVAAGLAACGVNLNLAPVIDLNLNPDNPIIGRYERSFGIDGKKVAAHAAVWIEEHHRVGIGCCLKHFPGHGSSGSDSHLGFVDVTASWREVELEPYRLLFAGGFADAVMSAHVVNRNLDPQALPATLSSVIMKQLLRRELGFEGVAVSDDLQMRAIADYWGFEEAVGRALVAGVDLLIIGNNLVRSEDAVRRGIRAIRALLDQGRLEERSLRRSLERVAVLKRKITGEAGRQDVAV